jgi:hypothetical protein
MNTTAVQKPTLNQSLSRAWLMIGFAVLLVVATRHAYFLALSNPFLRTDCLVAGIISGAGMAFSLGGAMHYLDSALAAGPRWYWSLLLIAEKRLLLIGQILAMALAVLSAGLMIFHAPIPGA